MRLLRNWRRIQTRMHGTRFRAQFENNGYGSGLRKTPACFGFSCCNSTRGEAEAIVMATDIKADSRAGALLCGGRGTNGIAPRVCEEDAEE